MNHFSKIRYSLVFNRKDQLNKYGEALIQIRAYQAGRNRYFTTGITILPEQWDKRNKKINHKHPNHFIYNQRIIQQLQDMEAFEIKMINQYGGFPLDRIDEYADQTGPDHTASFLKFFEYHIEQSGMKPGALKMYALTLAKWKAYRSSIFFQDLSYRLVLGFDRFLRSQDLAPNSIKKHHDRTRTIINYAIKEDCLRGEDQPYKKFKPKGEEPKRIYLTIEELSKLETLRFSREEQHLRRVRDIFLLTCYTGLRFGDISKITAGDISKNKQGYILQVKAQKTGKLLCLPLYFLFRSAEQAMSKPEAILNQYLEQLTPLSDTSGVEKIALFRVSNQYLNRSLKLVAAQAGIDKQISSHVGRRTFATIMARKVKAPVLQRLLQHARPDMTNIYIQLSNKVIEDELQAIEW